MNPDAVQFEQYWRSVISGEISAYNRSTHPPHDRRTPPCHRCDIDAVLSLVAQKVQTGNFG